MNTIAAVIIAILFSFALSAVLGIAIVPWLHKLKFGQTILDIGPNWHKKKQGTPTMGGFMFIISTTVTFLLIAIIDKAMGGTLIGGNSPLASATKVRIYAALLLGLGFGVIGFFDDYIKVVKKQNEGLTVIQKTFAQLFLIIAYVITMCLSGDQYMYVPFAGNVPFGNPFIFAIFAIVVIYATVNAVNFTDGIDGLCASVTVTHGCKHPFLRSARLLCRLSYLELASGKMLYGRHGLHVPRRNSGRYSICHRSSAYFTSCGHNIRNRGSFGCYTDCVFQNN